MARMQPRPQGNMDMKEDQRGIHFLNEQPSKALPTQSAQGVEPGPSIASIEASEKLSNMKVKSLRAGVRIGYN